MQEDQLLVTKITYLASLASTRDVINPMLDKLRSITFSWNRADPFKSEDRAALQQLLNDLKTYLVNDDPLRDFTAQTLDQSLQDLSRTDVKVSNILMQFYGSILGGIIIAGAVFLLSPVAIRLLLAIPLFLLTVSVGTIWLYASALQNFKQELRQAFIYICIGVIGVGVEFSHFTVVQLLNIGQTPLFKYGGFNLIASISFGLTYLGFRRYAKLVGVNTRSTQRRIVAVTLVVVAGVVVLLPHTTVPEPLFFDFALASDSTILVLSFFSFWLAHSIASKVTPGYAKSMRTMRLYMGFTCLASVTYCNVLPRIGVLAGTSSSILVGLSTVIPLLVLLYSGYLFKKGTTTERSTAPATA